MSDRDALQKRIKLVLGEVVSDEAFEMIRAQALEECKQIADEYTPTIVQQFDHLRMGEKLCGETIKEAIKQLKEQP